MKKQIFTSDDLINNSTLTMLDENTAVGSAFFVTNLEGQVTIKRWDDLTDNQKGVIRSAALYQSINDATQPIKICW